MSTREKFQERKLYLIGDEQRDRILALVRSLPADPLKPLEIVVREKTQIRKPSANDRMWAGPLKDIAEQAWVRSRQFSAETWHEHFKTLYLPDENSVNFDDSHVKEGYRKWDISPSCDHVLIGSTTQLTVKGFAIYMEQIHAFGANLGVEFSASPNEGGFQPPR